MLRWWRSWQGCLCKQLLPELLLTLLLDAIHPLVVLSHAFALAFRSFPVQVGSGCTW